MSAGIPAAGGVVDLALRHLAHRRLRKSKSEVTAASPADLYEALRADGLAFGQPYGASLYGELFDKHLDEANEQRRIIQEAITTGGRKINWAHLRLGQLIAENCVHTVLTTNFDQLALEGAIRCGVLPVVADGIEALSRIEPRPPHPQLIHWHGSLHAYSLRNSRRDVLATQRSQIAATALTSLLRDAPFLLVLGYNGGEEGVMELLARALRDLQNRPVFWCHRGPPSEHVTALKRDNDASVRLVEISGADEFLESIASGIGLGEPPWIADPIAQLRAECDRVAMPDGLALARDVRARHERELGQLAEALQRLRLATAPGERLAARVEDLLLNGNLSEARRLLDEAAELAPTRLWQLLMDAASERVSSANDLTVAPHIAAAVSALMRRPS